MVFYSTEGEPRFSHGQSIDRKRGRSYHRYSGSNHHVAQTEDDMTGEGRGEGSDGDQMAQAVRAASNTEQDGDDGVEI